MGLQIRLWQRSFSSDETKQKFLHIFAEKNALVDWKCHLHLVTWFCVKICVRQFSNLTKFDFFVKNSSFFQNEKYRREFI